MSTAIPVSLVNCSASGLIRPFHVLDQISNVIFFSWAIAEVVVKASTAAAASIVLKFPRRESLAKCLIGRHMDKDCAMVIRLIVQHAKRHRCQKLATDG